MLVPHQGREKGEHTLSLAKFPDAGLQKMGLRQDHLVVEVLEFREQRFDEL